MTTGTKARSLASAIAWRRELDGPLVFTNGVFDLLHVGHVELLEAARREGTALLVGVNTDASARSLGKGRDRPLVGETDRVRVLAGLAAVDCIVLFDEPTPLELIEAVQPEVLVKGGDYSAETVVGADVVRSHGGRVVIVPLVGGHSTTQLLERVRATT
jgi:D-beta-D-heptose 7-phosphate kinase/D-beta-D-heptose 1-phosphate adenosyltransferase